MTAMPPSMADRDGKIWMDGAMVDWRDAKIHVLTHTLHSVAVLSKGFAPTKPTRARRSSACRNTPTACLTARKSYA